MEETSLSLLDRIRESRDPQSWDRLVTLYAPLLRRWVLWYEVQASDADDLVQDVLTVVVSELPKFQHNERTGAFRSWLRAILVTRVRDFWRSRKYRPLATGTSSIDEKLNQLQDEASEMSQLWNRQYDRYVLKQLMTLVRSQFEPKTWQAFYLQAMTGLKPEAVAEELNMSMSGVYTARYRVLNALRREADGLIDEF